MLRFVFVIAAMLIGGWAEAETIAVKYSGNLDLKTFACTDVSRSSFINRAYYVGVVRIGKPSDNPDDRSASYRDLLRI